jgi:hypothetical protein
LAFRLPRSGVQWGSLTFAVGVALLLLLALGTLFGDNIKAIFGMEAGGMPMGDVTLERRTDIRRPALPPSETHDPRTAIPGFPRRPTNSNH